MSQETKPQTCLTSDFNNLNLSSIGNLKYPTSRIEYTFHTGELGEYAIRTIIKDLLSNIDILEHNVKVNGSDIQIFCNGKLIGKFEVLNFNSSSYIDSKRASSIKENLKGVKYKGLICSFYNATSKANRILRNIPKCTIGFQLLPSKFHEFYTKLNRVRHRKIANDRSLKELKNTIKSFFYRIGLDLLMYVSRTRISVSNTLNLKNEDSKGSSENIEAENKEARTEEKTESSTSREYTVLPSEGTTVKSSHFGSTFNDKPSSLKHNSMSSEGIGLEVKEISFRGKEISPSKGKISTVSVKIKTFYNRLKISMLNLLSGIEMLFPKLWKASRRVFYGCSQRMST
jgi:hypothetical protein